MLTFLRQRSRRLRWQLTFAFLLGFLIIGIAIGLPVILLIGQQSSLQAQLLLDQATVASGAFLRREQADLQSLALVISQRPTLRRLLEEQDLPALDAYLVTLREGAGLDMLLICSQGDATAGIQETEELAQLCRVDTEPGFVDSASEDVLYLYATAEAASLRGDTPRVIVGKNAISILGDLQKETGLRYFLLWQGRVVHAERSPTVPPAANLLLQGTEQDTGQSLQQRSLQLDQGRYILSKLDADPRLGLQLVSALNVDDQIALQQRLIRSLLFGLFLVVLTASGLSIWLSQRVSWPIARLADAAAKFRQGNLDSPISIDSSAWEIDQLANTLEDGRVALQHSLQQLQEEKNWIEHLLNSIVEGMLTLDHENKITFASAGIGKIVGEPPEQLLGHRINEVFMPLEGEAEFTSQLPAAGQQRRISVRLRNGQERLLSISKSQLVPPQASDSNRALVIRDVSNEEYIHRLLGDFMANITHEFRTPLAALEASSELMLDNLHDLSPEELEELLKSLNLGIINLQTLIDNLIEAASIEAGRFKVSLQPVPFERVLHEATEIIRPLAEKYSIRLDVQPLNQPFSVMADQRRTVQALVNLLSNAVKHSPEQSTIQVRHQVVGEMLRVEVIDQGSGIPAGQRGNLFRRFAHLDSENERARQGAGLGLSVVKEIVEAQQGEVGVAGQGEGGTTFWFTLPLVNGRDPA